MSAQEFSRLERRCKFVFLLFGGGRLAARRLGDPDRVEAMKDALDALNDD